jgi:uncharacterized protein (TIGR02118 family)
VSEAVKLVAWFKRKPGVSVESFQEEFATAQAAKAREVPGLRGYVQSLVLASAYRKLEPFCDVIAEIWFADAASAAAVRAGRGFADLVADAARFCAGAATGAMLTVEYLIKDGSRPTGGVKNIELVRRRPDLDVAEFHRYWREYHGPLASRIAPIRRYVQSHAIDDPGSRAYDGIASTWFDDTAAMRESATTEEYRLTRADEPNFVSGHLPFVITREHVVIEPPPLRHHG